MKKCLATASLVLLTASGTALASGYRIPEQSVNSTARSGSYVAYTPGADASYFNPANMAWLEDRGVIEADATWIHLTPIEYSDNRSALYNGESEEENFLMPTVFAVSPDYHNWRAGFSVTAPAGLAKRWEDPFPKTFSEEFSLKVFDINPTLAYKFCDRFAVAAGARAVFAEGTVKSYGQVASGVLASRDLEGDAWEAGYNLALTVRPLEKMNMSLTYRSKVDLGIEGDARLYTSVGPSTYAGDSGVEIPLPAILAVAVSYTFFDQLTVELEYDRTYWSDYEYLDFTYPSALRNPVLAMAFDNPKDKHWQDSDAWRLSASYALNPNLTLMAGFAIDENPVPESTLGFELPDSDALLYSVGFQYKINQHLEVGAAYLYDDKESRDVNNGTINGSFDEASAHLFTAGVTYKF